MKLYSNQIASGNRLTQLYLMSGEVDHLGGVGTQVSLERLVKPYIHAGHAYPYILKYNPNGRSRIVKDLAHSSGSVRYRVTTNFDDLPRTLRVPVNCVHDIDKRLLFRFTEIRNPEDPDKLVVPVSDDPSEGASETSSTSRAKEREAKQAEVEAFTQKQAEGFADEAFGAAHKARIKHLTETMRLVEAMARKLDAELFIDDSGILRAKVMTVI